MERSVLIQDKVLAEKICTALLAGDRHQLTEMVSAYQALFLPFARRRLFHPQDVEDVLQNFWEELMNGRAICHYARQMEPKVSLRSFCLGILNRRIIDRNRQVSKERERRAEAPPTSCQVDNPGSSPEYLLSKSATESLARGLVHAALIRLAELSPRDAELLRWRLTGLSYEEMAERLLKSGEMGAADVQKKINAIKKRLTRENSGSLARFKAILLVLMQHRGLSYDDL